MADAVIVERFELEVPNSANTKRRQAARQTRLRRVTDLQRICDGFAMRVRGTTGRFGSATSLLIQLIVRVYIEKMQEFERPTSVI
jgi:hypothetical protein